MTTTTHIDAGDQRAGPGETLSLSSPRPRSDGIEASVRGDRVGVAAVRVVGILPPGVGAGPMTRDPLITSGRRELLQWQVIGPIATRGRPGS